MGCYSLPWPGRTAKGVRSGCGGRGGGGGRQSRREEQHRQRRGGVRPRLGKRSGGGGGLLRAGQGRKGGEGEGGQANKGHALNSRVKRLNVSQRREIGTEVLALALRCPRRQSSGAGKNWAKSAPPLFNLRSSAAVLSLRDLSYIPFEKKGSDPQYYYKNIHKAI